MQASLIGNYADPRVAESVGRFLATLSENPEEIREGVLLMRFRSIEADAISYSDAESERDRAIRSLLMDLVSSAEDLISLYPAIRTMEAHRQALRFQTEERNLVLYRQHTTTLIELAKRSEVVSASVIDALSDGEKEIEALSTIVEAAHNETVRATAIERRAMVAGLQALDVRNFVVAPLSRLAEEFRPVAQ